MIWLRKLREIEAGVLVGNAGSLVGTQAVTSVLGVAFWLVAARRFSPAAVGFAAAAISAMALLGFLGMLGLGTLLMGELPRLREGRGSLISTALITSGATGALLGFGFSLIASKLSKSFVPLIANVESISLFTIAVALTAASLVLDSALIGLLRGHVQFARNVIFAASKLLILLFTAWLVHGGTGLLILAAWVLGTALSLVAMTRLIKGQRPARYRPQPRLLGGLAGSALGHHALNLGVQLPALGLPVLVAAVLSVRLNAAFYIAWNVVGFLFVVPTALTNVLYAMGSAASARGLAAKLRMTIGISFAIGLGGAVVLFLGANPVLRVFGHSYATQAAWTMRILAIGVFPVIVKTHYIALCRIRRQLALGAVTLVAGGLFELGMAGLGASRGGLIGLSLYWVAAVCVEALIMARPLWRAAYQKPVLAMVGIARKAATGGEVEVPW